MDHAHQVIAYKGTTVSKHSKRKIKLKGWFILKVYNRLHGSTYYGRLVFQDEGVIQYKQIMRLGNVECSAGLIQDVYATAILVYEHWLDDIAKIGLTKITIEEWEANQ